jgi:hypothetical protein
MFQKLLLIGALLAPIGNVAFAGETSAPAATSRSVKNAKSAKRSGKKVTKQGRKARSNSRRPKAQRAAVSDAGRQ